MQAERVLATLCVALAPSQEAVAPTAQARWPIGLFAVHVSEAPRENLLASRLGWIGNPRTMRFEVEPDGAALRVRIVESSDFTNTFVELCLDASGARASASDRSCVSSWSGAALAGTACLVTDGKTAAVEFEIYDGAEVWYPEAFFGRVDLGERGAQLARAVAARPSAETALRHERQRCSLREREGGSRELEISGSVDALGRRQGLWTVRETTQASPELEMTWRDGIPDGLFRMRNESFELYIGSFVHGFLEGQTIVWERTGERTVEQWAGGQMHGTRAVYDAEGRKLRESRFEHGVGVGPTLVWLPGQSEAVEEPNSSAFGRDRPEVEGARWGAFRTKLAQLHTRQ